MVSEKELLLQRVGRDTLFRQSPGTTHKEVLMAMSKVDRACFLRGKELARAYWDVPRSIGFEQTCSQPSTLATLLQLLDIHPGQRILEIGTGCGYAATIAAEMAGEQGYVVSVERILDLVKLAQENAFHYFGAEWKQRMDIVYEDGSRGGKRNEKYDRIFFSAGTEQDFDLSPFEQLLQKEAGVIVAVHSGDVYHLGPMRKYVYVKEKLQESIDYGRFCFVGLRENTI